MTLNLSFTGLGPNRGTKEVIISILTDDWPLSAKEIYNVFSKRTDKEVSYQAVHKALSELDSDKVIDKKGKGYQLNKKWIDNTINTFSQLKEKYSGKIGKFSLDEDFSVPKKYKFTSLTDLSVSLADLLRSRIFAKESEKEFASVMEYGLFSFKFNFDHIYLLFRMMQNNPGSVNIIRRKTPFGKWIREQYIKVGGVSAPLGTKFDIDEDIFVQGDYIIEVRYSEETKKKLFDKYYNEFRGINDLFKGFVLKKEPEIEAKVTVSKNPIMAKFIRKKIINTVENSLKKTNSSQG